MDLVTCFSQIRYGKVMRIHSDTRLQNIMSSAVTALFLAPCSPALTKPAAVLWAALWRGPRLRALGVDLPPMHRVDLDPASNHVGEHESGPFPFESWDFCKSASALTAARERLWAGDQAQVPDLPEPWNNKCCFTLPSVLEMYYTVVDN